MKGINPQYLRVFHEVLTHRSVRTAAEALNTAPSVVTRQIKKLEIELAVPLFERRHRRGMAPTEAGEVLAEYYRNNCEQQARLDNHLRQIRDKQRGTIYIAIAEGYVPTFMDEILLDFMGQYPKIQINLRVASANSIVTDLVEDTAHIGLAWNPPSDPLIQHYAYAKRPLSRLAVGKGHPLASKQRVKFSEATHYPFGLVTSEFGMNQIVRQLTSFEEIELKPVFTTNSLQALKKFIQPNSDAICIAPPLTQQEMQSGERVTLEIETDPSILTSGAYLMLRKDRPLSAAADELLNRTKAKLSILQQ